MRTNYSILIVILAFLFPACTPYYYLPTKQNVMVFEKKGDVILSANLGFNDFAGLEGGYAITDNIGLYSSFNAFDISNTAANSQNLSDFIWDNEIVLFKKYNSGLYTGVNIGVGFGELDANNPYYVLGLNRQFVQPVLGYTFDKRFDFAISSRLTRLNYSIKSLIDISSEYDKFMFNSYFDVNELSKSSYFFIEPALTFGLNYEFLKVKFQYSLAHELFSKNLSYISNNLTTTVSFNLNKIFIIKKNKTSKF